MAVEFSQYKQGEPGPIRPEVLSRSYELAVAWARMRDDEQKNFRAGRFKVVGIAISQKNWPESHNHRLISTTFSAIDADRCFNASFSVSDEHLNYHFGSTKPFGMRRTRIVSYNLDPRSDTVYYGCVNDVSNLHVFDRTFQFGRFLREDVNSAVSDLNLIVGACLGLVTIPENHKYYWDNYL